MAGPCALHILKSGGAWSLVSLFDADKIAAVEAAAARLAPLLHTDGMCIVEVGGKVLSSLDSRRKSAAWQRQSVPGGAA